MDLESGFEENNVKKVKAKTYTPYSYSASKTIIMDPSM